MTTTAQDSQRMSALARANTVRCRRRALKADLRAGRKTLEAALYSRKWWTQTMPVRTVLLAVPGLGEVKVERALRAASLTPHCTLRGCPSQTKRYLLDYLSENFPAAQPPNKTGGRRPRPPIPEKES